MFVVAVVNLKGGCGKTTVATHLAARYARAGHRTWLGDLDRQGSALQWARRRPPELPEIQAVAADAEELDVPRGDGRAVLDVPAGLNRKRLEALVRASDALVVPLLPSLFDEAATERFLRSVSDIKPVRKGKRPVAVVPNRVRAGSVAARRLDTFLEGLAFPAITRLSDSSSCVAAADTGRTIFDLPPGRTRKLREEWAPLLTFLDELAGG